MSRVGRWVKGRRPTKATETVANLRKTINNFTLKSQSLKRMADEEQDLAKTLLRDGNRSGAAQALKRRKMYLGELNATHSKVANLRRIISTIRTTQDNVTLTKALGEADKVIQTSLREASPEHTEELMTRLEDSIEQASYVDEALSSTEITEIGMDVDDLEDIENQLESLENEIRMELGTPEPTTQVPSGTPTRTPPVSSTPRETTASREDKIREEMARVKKELQQELQE
ncbi:MAG: Snf7 family protein [Candidatus Hodarchaeota archaeon]